MYSSDLASVYDLRLLHLLRSGRPLHAKSKIDVPLRQGLLRLFLVRPDLDTDPLQSALSGEAPGRVGEDRTHEKHLSRTNGQSGLINAFF